MGRLDGKVAIVTGAGKGIGRSIAHLFSEEGAAVGIIDVDEEAGAAAAAEIAERSGARAAFACANVSNESAVREAVAKIAGELGGPTVLVNNAGISVFHGVDASPEEWREIIDVNVIGPALVAKHVIPYMRAAGAGAIVNIASVSAVIAQKGFLTYNASKAALVAMARCMAIDLAEDNIRVNSICPGATWTEGVERIAAERGFDRSTAASQPNLGLEHMLQRLADPREIAYAVLFLASDEASFITAANLMVDAGWSAH